MMLAGRPPVHLTYCTNIHPGETWDEVRRNLETHVLAVKRRVAPTEPFGIGLRLSHQAAVALEEPATLAAFREFLAHNQLYVFTLNGFPYGPFHGQPVKENVYRPDWLEDERLDYTDRLARILAALLPRNLGAQPETLEGSISTVPGCFRGRATPDDRAALAAMAQRLIRHAATLHRIRAAGGPTITLALEPEPHCVFETITETVSFFTGHLFTDRAGAQLAELIGGAAPDAEAVLRRHLGVCLDACHAAVEFEDPATMVALLKQHGVRVLKIQISTGLRLRRPSPESLAVLRRFAEGVYLHQTVIKRGDKLIRHLDLPEALAAGSETREEEWRVHFHVPIFAADLAGLAPGFENTHADLAALLRLQARDTVSHHLEVETYTWDVLPPELRALPVDEAIARELGFARDALRAPG